MKTDDLFLSSRRRLGQRRYFQTHSRQARDPALRFVQTRKAAPFIRRSSSLAHDGGKSAR